MSKKYAAIGAVVSLLALGLAWYFRPWLQWIVFGIYTTPTLWVLTAATVALGGYALMSMDDSGPSTAVQALAAVIIIGFIVASISAGFYASEDLSDRMMGSAEPTNNLSDVDAQQPRIVPGNVASNYAANTLDLPQYQTTKRDITFVNDTPHWSYALAPDGTRNHFALQQRGTVLVDMTQQNADVRTINDKMDAGIGTAFYNHYKWEVLKNGQYLANYEDPFMVPHNGESYIAVPYTKPNFNVRFAPIPTPYTTPEWGGVALVGPDGEVTDLSPQEARNHPVLKGQKLVPFDLTKKKVKSTKFRNGIVNTLPVVGAHSEEIEVAPTPGKGNDQPYMMPTQNGTKYVVAAEPYGNAQGLKEVWEVDGRTGNPVVYESPDGESLFGPRKAANYVRQAARTTDWDRFTPAEPLPTVVDGQLYWMVRVIPNDGTGVSYVAFVNAESSNVREVSDTPAVEAFLDGQKSAGEVAAGGNNTNASGDVSVIVEKRNANGTVVSTLQVYDNESVSIQPAGNNSTRASG
ncbi:ABC transporter permease [Halococcus saccharolyticus]|uniref:Uncharacterized protein n=1 Tax=Halococcus saccharolyticus DSM 5350 TaxID=1227455 RepID=M0MT57_9EURY|nr:ABC transporter permease [Halococcus saccharolyticus]EMA47929.1 hypothetical protein C449_00615 [Halococcus saccharolyticus DSM 5350]